jgi:Flp pilus assembly pilin Flp
MRGRHGERREDGASLVEYALLIALIALVAFLSLRFFGGARDNSRSRSGSAIFTGVIYLRW